MGLPLSREQTLGPGSVWPSAVGNILQDCIVGAKHGLVTVPIAVVPVHITNLGVTGVWATISGSGSAANTLLSPLLLAVGTTISAIRARIVDNTSGGGNAGPTRVQMALSIMVENSDRFSTVKSSDPSRGDGTEQTISMLPNTKTLARTQYYLYVSTAFAQPGAAACKVFRAEMDIFRD